MPQATNLLPAKTFSSTQALFPFALQILLLSSWCQAEIPPQFISITGTGPQEMLIMIQVHIYPPIDMHPHKMKYAFSETACLQIRATG